MFCDVVVCKIYVVGSPLNCSFEFFLRFRLVIVADHERKDKIRWEIGPAYVRRKVAGRPVIDANDLELFFDCCKKVAMKTALLEILGRVSFPAQPVPHCEIAIGQAWFRVAR